MVDAANAFNNMNQKVFLHNIKFTCQEITTYVNNCYSVPARLFVSRNLELTSHECSTQDALLNMVIYATEITPKLDMNTKMIITKWWDLWMMSLESLERLWDILMQVGPNHGYYPQPTKSWLIVKKRIK